MFAAVFIMSNYSGPRRGRTPLTAIIQIFLGVLYGVLAGYIILTKSFARQPLAPGVAYGLGALLLAYGVFRIWRGFQLYRQARDGDI